MATQNSHLIALLKALPQYQNGNDIDIASIELIEGRCDINVFEDDGTIEFGGHTEMSWDSTKTLVYIDRHTGDPLPDEIQALLKVALGDDSPTND